MKDSVLLETIFEMLGVSHSVRSQLQLEFKNEQHRKRVETEAECYLRAYPKKCTSLVHIDDVISLRKHKPSVIARIRRLNPEYVSEGSRIRGLYYHRRHDFALDVVPLRKYEQRWGSRVGADIVYKSGRWKFVSGVSYMQGPYV